MKIRIRHEIKGRMRVHLVQNRMTCSQADILLYYLQKLDGVTEAKVYERTQDAVIRYRGDRAAVLKGLQSFRYDRVEVPEGLIENSGREMNARYQEKLVMKVLLRFASKLFVPWSLRALVTAVKSVKYLKKGAETLAKGKIEVPVLDAVAIGVSVFRGDMDTASSVMFLLGVGELLEEWTHKKSVDDLARTMSLNVSRVWQKTGDQELLVSASQIREDDLVVVHMGNVIPFDGLVEEGEAMVNQSSLTGESVPVRRIPGNSVYAGSVVEEGELTVRVKAVGGSSRFEKIVTMIEESEKLKSSLEGKAEHLADSLVPWTLMGTILVWLLTRNVTKALAVLMVDFSCALKLAMPISVLSAIREAGRHHVTVKGGKYLEAVAEAETIVFDKTGTLTRACPTVATVISFNGETPDELLRIAACLEEHFPHSMARAVVEAAKKKKLDHQEMHSKVEYMVAHGISTTIGEKRVVIGSCHFVFEDEKCTVPEGKEALFASLPEEYSHLYLAMDNHLAAVICIEDPLREEAAEIIRSLKAEGIRKVVMMTGDSAHTARAIAKKTGVDQFYAEVLPEDKASFIEKEKAKGRKVIMVGDGINDYPALSAADAGIAVSGGAQLAREISDITISGEDLHQLVILKKVGNGMMKRIHRNYRFVIGFNGGLIFLGLAGILANGTSAFLHNMSTLGITLESMTNMLDKGKNK